MGVVLSLRIVLFTPPFSFSFPHPSFFFLFSSPLLFLSLFLTPPFSFSFPDPSFFFLFSSPLLFLPFFSPFSPSFFSFLFLLPFSPLFLTPLPFPPILPADGSFGGRKETKSISRSVAGSTVLRSVAKTPLQPSPPSPPTETTTTTTTATTTEREHRMGGGGRATEVASAGPVCGCRRPTRCVSSDCHRPLWSLRQPRICARTVRLLFATQGQGQAQGQGQGRMGRSRIIFPLSIRSSGYARTKLAAMSDDG